MAMPPINWGNDMYQSVWIIVALPLAAFIILTLAGSVLSKRKIAWIGAGAVSAGAIFTAVLLARFLIDPPAGPLVTTLWNWIASGPLRVDLAFSPNSPRFFGYQGTYDQLLFGTGQAVQQRIDRFQFHFSLGQAF